MTIGAYQQNSVADSVLMLGEYLITSIDKSII